MEVEAGGSEVGWNDGISWVWPIMKKKKTTQLSAGQ